MKFPKPYYLSIRFKNKPTFNTNIPTSADLRDLITFAEIFFNQFIEEEGLQDFKENMKVYIGHPSGWKGKPSDEYQYCFENNRFIPNVYIVPESRAAFIQIKDKSKESKTDEHLTSVLVIDIGSSTTDFTFVKDLEAKDLALGDALGMGLLDEVARKLITAKYPKKKELEQRLEMYQEENSQLDFLCRKLKEYIFLKKDSSDISTDNISTWLLTNVWGNRPIVTEKELLKTKIPKLKSTWQKYFKNLLIEAKEQIDADIKMILVTGGGSRADFTLNVCREIFGEGVRIERDNAPHLCVSRGLARYGRWRYKVNKFYQVLNKFCRSEELKEIVLNNSHKFLDKAKNLQLNSQVVENVWRPVIMDFYSLKIKPEEFSYVERIKLKLHNWLTNTKEGKQLWEEYSLDFIKAISPFIENKTNAICKEYDIEPAKLKIDLKIPESLWESDWEFMDKAIDKIFKFVYKKIHPLVSDKNKEEIEKFLNTKGMKIAFDIYFTTGGFVAEGVSVAKQSFEKMFKLNVNPANNKSKRTFQNGITFQIEQQLIQQAKKIEKYLD